MDHRRCGGVVDAGGRGGCVLAEEAGVVSQAILDHLEMQVYEMLA